MRSFALRIEKLITAIGRLTSFFLAVLLVAIVSQVFLRYALNITSTMLEDSLWYLFAATLVLGLSFTMTDDGHVRVDFLYQRYSERTKRIVDLIGIILFLIPLYTFLMWHGWEYAAKSFHVNESSPNPGGMPWLWLVKGLLPVSCFLLLLESIARAVIILTDKERKDTSIHYGS